VLAIAGYMTLNIFFENDFFSVLLVFTNASKDVAIDVFKLPKR